MTATKADASIDGWRWIAGFWCVFALFEATQSIFMLHSEGKHHGELRLFVTEFATWLPWMFATPFIIRLARRRPIIPAPNLSSVIAHSLTLVTLTLAAQAWAALLQVTFNPWLNHTPPLFWTNWGTNLIYQGLNCLAAYGFVLTITYLMDTRDKEARQTTEAARLAAELSEAQLAALRRQIEPHFMFNALNSIAGLVRDRRNDTAVDMIVGLSEFLRRATEDAHRPEVPLAEEVEYLQRYVEIQKLRFADRLEVSMDFPADLLEAQVPSLLLQPLVENAIKHGIAKRAAGGAIRIAGARRNGCLHLSVRNDGPEAAIDWDKGGAGVGLANLRTRLRILHGDAADIQMRSIEGMGVEVVVSLPLAGA